MIDKTAPGMTSEFTTTIGSDATIKGELSFSKGLRVDGTVEGKIHTKGHLTIAQGGKVQAEVEAGNVVLEGEIIGNVKASDRLELRKTAKLKGDLRAAKLLVAEGASFIGHCLVGPDAANAPTPVTTPNRLSDKEILPRK